MSIRLSFVALVAAVASTATVAAPVSHTDDAMTAKLDQYLTRASAVGFAGQVLVARHDSIIFHRAYGAADRAAGRAMTVGTPLGLASMSKQFTAAAILALVDAHKLTLDDHIDRWLAHVPPDKQRITIQQLLTHTGGIASGVTNDFEDPSLDSVVSRILGEHLMHPPGLPMTYGSENYILLAAIIERASGEPYATFLHRAVFAPAGMTHTTLVGESPISPAAHAYIGWRDSGSPSTWPANWRYSGAGDVVSTAEDLYRWTHALRSGAVLTKASLARYHTPQVPIEDGDQYGYGLFFQSSTTKRQVIEHGGDTDLGFNGVLRQFLADDVVLVITCNARAENGLWYRWGIGGDVERIVFGEQPTRTPPALEPLTASARREMAGSYRIGGGGALQLVDDGALAWLVADGAGALAVLRPAADRAASDSAIVAVTSLLSALKRRDVRAYPAVSDSSLSAEAIVEWRELTEHYGSLVGFAVQGAMAEGRTVRAFTRLHFATGDVSMVFRWSRTSPMRLVATNPHAPAYPIALAVAREHGGDLRAYALDRPGPTITLRVAGDSLVLANGDRSTVAGPKSLGGWSPARAPEE